ncbi:MAG: nitroreductase family protein [Armatimonadota bacterium]
MTLPAIPAGSQIGENERYRALMEIVHGRYTCRAFASYVVPREHCDLILEAARHAPSGANSQPWHFIVITDPKIKEQLGDRFVQEQLRRARLGMKFPTPNYKGMRTAPGLIVVAADFRFVRAFPILSDGSALDRLYQQNAERILLQSVAAATMLAHLAAAALGYGVWWVTAIGQEEIQKELKPLLGVPDELSLIDIMCFGPPAQPPYKRWKKRLDQIMNWGNFNAANFMTNEQVDEWVKNERARVMYRDESRVD